MQKADRYRQFSETLALAAKDASGSTRDLILQLAHAWRALASEADGGARACNVIDFASATQRSRLPTKPTERARRGRKSRK